MRIFYLICCLLVIGSMTGCAVLQSPKSWAWKDPGTNTPNVGPTEIKLGTNLETVSDSLAKVTTYHDLLVLISNTRAAVANEKSAVRATLDEASGGNYGWGILGAAAAVANMHVSVLKGLALGGGIHVALSTRLSPKDQIATLTDTITRLGCVAEVARTNSAAQDALTKSKGDLSIAISAAQDALAKSRDALTKSKSELRPKSEAHMQPLGTRMDKNLELNSQAALALMDKNLELNNQAVFALTDKPLESKTQATLNLDDFRAAVENILYNASNKIDGIYTTALGNNSTASDLVSSTNTLVTKLKGNAAVASTTAAAAAKKDTTLKSALIGDEKIANDVTDAKKAVAEAQKNADDAAATATVRLAACQT
jgi:hypothetical protein